MVATEEEGRAQGGSVVKSMGEGVAMGVRRNSSRSRGDKGHGMLGVRWLGW